MTQPVSISNLSKTYRTWRRRIRAVRNVSFAVEQGQVVGLIGPNGAGKTTTLKVLLGFVAPTEGQTTIFGIPSDQPASRQGLGFVPENAALYDFLTPLESMREHLVAHRCKVDQPIAHCLKWLEKLGIADAAKRPIRFLSKGMTQRLALAQALAIQPKLLVLDEPLSGLDPGGRMEVVDALQEYRKSGGAILFSSHVLFDVERLADRFVMIDHGEVKADMSMQALETLSTHYRVRSTGSTPPEAMRADGEQTWIGDIERDQLERHLVRLVEQGHRIIEVRPILNLETLYLKISRENQSN